jgi:acyl dehydratase
VSLAVGDVVAEQTYTLTRDTLVRYAGASGDFNPIHYRDDVAQSVGLPGVLAHGMLTMGLAVQPVVDWLGGDSGKVIDYQVRFTRPVLVDAESGAVVTVVAKVGAIDDTGTRIDLTVTFADETVLGKAQVRVAAGA